MLVSVLCSGSKGNCTLIRTKTANFLIDAGSTAKNINEKLKENNLSLKDINYILLSHTHKDHTSALNVIVKKYNPTIILSEIMYNDLEFLNDYDNIMFLKDNLVIGEVLIENIKTSHDASDSRGYIITEGSSSLVQITDTGYLNQKYFSKLQNKNLYIMESNHNLEMLLNGRYPKWLKARVASDVGHLSNESSAFYLSKLIGKDTKKIILAHLSEENNTPELALETLKNELIDHNIEFTNYEAAKQYEKTKEVEV